MKISFLHKVLVHTLRCSKVLRQAVFLKSQ
nr:MAG TPA: hypothetical protein [Caudoviricetes sp.]